MKPSWYKENQNKERNSSMYKLYDTQLGPFNMINKKIVSVIEISHFKLNRIVVLLAALLVWHISVPFNMTDKWFIQYDLSGMVTITYLYIG